MKNLKISFTLCLVVFFFSSDLAAQNYWLGGSPGHETNWNYARNWSKNHVPDWTEDVIVTDVSSQSGFFPVIDHVIDEIPHLEIRSNAKVTVLPFGRLVIDGSSTYKSGILLNGTLIATGEINIANVAELEIEQKGGEMYLRKGVWVGY